MDRAKLLSLAIKAADLLDQWIEGEKAASLLIGNFDNVYQRLPALAKPCNYDGVLSSAPELTDLQRRVCAKQVSSAAAVLARLQASISADLTDVVRQQEKVCVDAWAALGAGASAASCATAVAGTATPAQLVEAMEDTWYMCRDELCLKQAIVSRVHLAISADELQELISLFRASVNIRRACPSYILLGTRAFVVAAS